MNVIRFPSLRFSQRDLVDLESWGEALPPCGEPRLRRPPLVKTYDGDAEFAALEVEAGDGAFGFVISPSPRGWLLESPLGGEHGAYRTLRALLDRVLDLVGGAPASESENLRPFLLA